MSHSRRELQQKILGTKRVRKIAYIGLVVGVVVVLLSLLLPFSLLFILGYTVFIICTGISSFTIILNWQYNKALKAQTKKTGEPLAKRTCSRCGMAVDKTEKYCSKCGKKTPTRKR